MRTQSTTNSATMVSSSTSAANAAHAFVTVHNSEFQCSSAKHHTSNSTSYTSAAAILFTATKPLAFLFESHRTKQFKASHPQDNHSGQYVYTDTYTNNFNNSARRRASTIPPNSKRLPPTNANNTLTTVPKSNATTCLKDAAPQTTPTCIMSNNNNNKRINVMYNPANVPIPPQQQPKSKGQQCSLVDDADVCIIQFYNNAVSGLYSVLNCLISIYLYIPFRQMYTCVSFYILLLQHR